MSSTPAILTYPQIAVSDSCGQKAATVARLALAGYRVPRGVGLSSSLTAGLLDSAAPVTPERAIDAIAAFDLNGVRDALLRALPTERLMVRSSSPLEDLPDRPSYGVYRSVLTTPDGLIAAIRECLGAAYREAALNFKARTGLAALEPHALLIQEYIDASPSGVGLSADLPRQRGDVMLVELTDGPCSDVTSGAVIPTSYQRWTHNGRTERIAGVDEFDPELVARVFALVSRVSATLSFPVEVEFTDAAAPDPVVLQARALPTYALAPLPDSHARA